MSNAKPKDAAVTQVRDLIRALLGGFIYHKSDLIVDAKHLGSVMPITINTRNPEDWPRLIGKSGLHIAAVNQIMRAVGRKLRVTIVLTFKVPPPPKTPVPSRQFQPNPKWKPDETRKLLRRVIDSIFSGRVELDECHDPDVSVFQIIPFDDADDRLFDESLLASFESIFDAIGKANGHIVKVTGVSDEHAG